VAGAGAVGRRPAAGAVGCEGSGAAGVEALGWGARGWGSTSATWGLGSRIPRSFDIIAITRP